MTNAIALILAFLVAALFVADRMWLGWNLPVFLGRHMAALIEYLSFWR